MLFPILKPNTVFVLDNASQHHSKFLKEYAKKYQIIVLYLPKYCPHLNPIEHEWFWYKNIIKKALPKCNNNLADAITLATQSNLDYFYDSKIPLQVTPT
jgi:transposase